MNVASWFGWYRRRAGRAATMNAKLKILGFAVAPLLLAIMVIGALLLVETQRLEKQQAEVLKDVFLGAKQEELRNYVTRAMTSLDHL